MISKKDKIKTEKKRKILQPSPDQQITKSAIKKAKSDKKILNKSTMKKPVSHKTKSTTTKTKGAATVDLPSNVPLRLVRKSNFLTKLFNPEITKSVYKVSYVSSLCFILIGSTLIMSSLLTNPADFSSEQRALVRDSADNTLSTVSSLSKNTEKDSSSDKVAEAHKVSEQSTDEDDDRSDTDDKEKESNEETSEYAEEKEKHDETEETETGNHELEQPKFDFTTSIPDRITRNFPIFFSATHVNEVKVNLINVGSNVGYSSFTTLEVSHVNKDEFKVTLPVADLETGFYKMRVSLETLDGKSRINFDSSEFFVGTKQEEDNLLDTDDAAADQKNPENEAEEKDEDWEDEDGEEEDKEGDKEADEEAEDEKVETNGVDSEVEDEIHDSEENNEKEESGISNDETAQQSEKNDYLKFKVYSKSKKLSKTAVIHVEKHEDFEFVELYVRPVQSLTSRFVALAANRSDGWQFIFDTENIPNGKYELVAKARVGDTEIKSRPLKIKVDNKTPHLENRKKSTSESDDESTSKEAVERNEDGSNEDESDDSKEDKRDKKFDGKKKSAAETEEDEKLKEYFSDSSVREFSLDKPETDKELKGSSHVDSKKVDRETELLLTKNSDEITALLRRYAVAIQAGDTTLIDSIENSIDQKRIKMVNVVLKDDTKNEISDDVDMEITKSLAIMKKKVTVFEEVRHDRSKGKSAVDTDKDGVSDVDEIKIYKSDPKLADSDGDGVTDGVEIMRGFNPIDASAEAVITFQSPKKSLALAREDALVIEDVTAVINTAATENTKSKPVVSAEIRGKALPNSFVTLYIFSTPTVVTIRTDADGSFVYTFDKELDDGRHDVYVTMTDNTGDIVAQSNPFSFIKEAQAFTPVDAAEDQTINTISSVQEDGKTYNIAVGMGILSLGIILLMLGINLRSKDEEGLDSQTNESFA